MKKKLKKNIKKTLIVFMCLLALSGVTAFPLEWELNLLNNFLPYIIPETNPLMYWANEVGQGIRETNFYYPFMAYGTDWLAFAHLILALLFLGPLVDPVKNIWVIKFGIIACLLIFPFAFIAGAVREIPLFWRLIDCSFGALGIIPLMACHQWTRKLETISQAEIN